MIAHADADCGLVPYNRAMLPLDPTLIQPTITLFAPFLDVSFNPLDPATVITALVGAIVSLSGLVYKLQTDRIKAQATQIDKLTSVNETFQNDQGKLFAFAETQIGQLDRILTIVGDIRYDGVSEQTNRPYRPSRPPPRRARPLPRAGSGQGS